MSFFLNGAYITPNYLKNSLLNLDNDIDDTADLNAFDAKIKEKISNGEEKYTYTYDDLLSEAEDFFYNEKTDDYAFLLTLNKNQIMTILFLIHEKLIDYDEFLEFRNREGIYNRDEYLIHLLNKYQPTAVAIAPLFAPLINRIKTMSAYPSEDIGEIKNKLNSLTIPNNVLSINPVSLFFANNPNFTKEKDNKKKVNIYEANKSIIKSEKFKNICKQHYYFFENKNLLLSLLLKKKLDEDLDFENIGNNGITEFNNRFVFLNLIKNNPDTNISKLYTEAYKRIDTALDQYLKAVNIKEKIEIDDESIYLLLDLLVDLLDQNEFYDFLYLSENNNNIEISLQRFYTYLLTNSDRLVNSSDINLTISELYKEYILLSLPKDINEKWNDLSSGFKKLFDNEQDYYTFMEYAVRNMPNLLSFNDFKSLPNFLINTLEENIYEINNELFIEWIKKRLNIKNEIDIEKVYCKCDVNNNFYDRFAIVTNMSGSYISDENNILMGIPGTLSLTEISEKLVSTSFINKYDFPERFIKYENINFERFDIDSLLDFRFNYNEQTGEILSFLFTNKIIKCINEVISILNNNLTSLISDGIFSINAISNLLISLNKENDYYKKITNIIIMNYINGLNSDMDIETILDHSFIVDNDNKILFKFLFRSQNFLINIFNIIKKLESISYKENIFEMIKFSPSPTFIQNLKNLLNDIKYKDEKGKVIPDLKWISIYKNALIFLSIINKTGRRFSDSLVSEKVNLDNFYPTVQKYKDIKSRDDGWLK